MEILMEELEQKRQKRDSISKEISSLMSAGNPKKSFNGRHSVL